MYSDPVLVDASDLMDPSTHSARRLLFLLFGAVWVLLGTAAGCRHDPGRLSALELERAPTEEEWAGAIPVRVEARGGQMSQRSDSDVDSDTVHKATASCHHGTGVPSMELDARAFYTPERLFLRFEWKDPTMDEGPSWRWTGVRWAAGRRAGADGLAVLWGAPGGNFSCTQMCHMQDWRMAGPRGLADYTMRAPPGRPPLDLWVWRAGRGAPGGMAEDAGLGPEGFQGDGPGDLFSPNSSRARATKPNPFDEGDVPVQAPPPEPGAWAPAYVSQGAGGGRVEVAGRAVWKNGVWTLTLSRPLRGSDPGDEEFSPGSDHVLGVSIFDGVVKDHNAVATPIRLTLVDRRALLATRD